jgi:uncharacterized protein (TIGR03437 family)
VNVPTPQVLSDGVYAFAGWSDGPTQNPRVFPAGFSSNVSPKMRKMTEPWVDPNTPVLHAGSYRTGPVAPGEIISLFGYNLGPQKGLQAALDSSGRIATSVAGFQALFDGVAAPVVYTSAGQSSVIMPYSVAGKAAVQMTLVYNNLNSAPVTIGVTDSVPGFLTANSSGSGELAAYNSDNSLNSVSNPAPRGDIVVLYGSGEGLTDPLPPDGQLGGAVPTHPRLPVWVTIGGQVAEIVYVGGVSGVTEGLLQLNVRIPANVSPGRLPVLMTIGTNTSQREATIAVR